MAPKAALQVARQLCRQIVEREIAPGERLAPADDLATSFGVSRAVLRESMRLLEWDGLVRIHRGARGGAEVTAPDARVAARYSALVLQARETTLEDFDTAVTALEPQLARMVAEDASADGHGILQRALDDEGAVLKDGQQFVLRALHFHDVLTDASGNRVLQTLGAMLNEIRDRRHVSSLALHADLSARQGRRVTSHAEHTRLYELIRTGRADEAEVFWRAHVRSANAGLPAISATTLLDLFEQGLSGFEWTSRDGRGDVRAQLPKGADVVAGVLRGRILRGELEEGSSLPTEGALASSFGLSRASVREGLRILEAEHLVLPARGARSAGRVISPSVELAGRQAGLVAQYSGATVGELLAARELVELSLVGMMSGPALRRHAGLLSDAVNRCRAARTPVGWAEALGGFSDAIVDTATNRTLRVLHELTRPLLTSSLTDHPGSRGVARIPEGVVQMATEAAEAARRGDASGVTRVWADLRNEVSAAITDVLGALTGLDVFRADDPATSTPGTLNGQERN